MARLLRSNIQDFVQEVPVGQMAQGTPFRCLPWLVGKGRLPSVQHATQGSADMYICTYICIYIYIYIFFFMYMYLFVSQCSFEDHVLFAPGWLDGDALKVDPRNHTRYAVSALTPQ